MVETYRRIELLDDAQEYADAIRARNWRVFGLMLALLIVTFSVFILIREFKPEWIDYSPLVALGVAFCIILPALIWNYPHFGFYLLVFGACVCTQTTQQAHRDPFGTIPLFWNITTAVEYFFKSNALHGVHFTLAELVMVMTFLFWLMRQVTLRQFKWNPGAFFGWLSLYIVWCIWGFVRGWSRGGDLTIALWELRAQAYFLMAYLMGCNLVTDYKYARNVLWAMMLGIAAKSVVGAANWASNPDVTADEGVLSHEDSLLMNFILFSAIIYPLAKVEPKLKWFAILFLPTALATSLANGRRAGIAAFIVAFPVVMCLCVGLLRERRKQVLIFLVGFSLASAVYLPAAWNAAGPWALPARAIRSRTSPDQRDAASDAYRIAENGNLKATRASSPWLGYGYGRPYFRIYDMPGRYDTFTWYLPHNGILWIWMRLGHLGFIFFWMFVAYVLVRGPQLLQVIRDPHLQSIGILAIASLLMLIIYGQYDLAFANYRSMLLTGTLVGLLAALPRLVTLKQEERAVAGLGRSSQGVGDDLDVREMEDTEPLLEPSPRPRLGSAPIPKVDW